MNTKHLAKLYDQLTPHERVPLIMAAGARSDQAEQKHLTASAPKETYEVPNYYGLAKALKEAGDFHLLTLLDLAANFWQWWGLWTSYLLREPGETATKKSRRGQNKFLQRLERRACGIVRYYASRFLAHVEGWKQFCSELQIDPEAQLNFMIGWETIRRTEESARDLAFSDEEAALFLRAESLAREGEDALEKGPAPVETAVDLAKSWHVLLDKFMEGYGCETPPA
jgi:hypothetical protein